MNENLLKSKIEKLNKAHKINSWVSLVFSFSLLALSFFMVEASTSDSNIALFNLLALKKVDTFLVIVAGVLLGNTWRNWNGSKELKLLNEITNPDMGN